MHFYGLVKLPNNCVKMKKISLILYLIIQNIIVYAAKTDTLVLNQLDSHFLTNQYYQELEDPNHIYQFTDIFNSNKFHTTDATLPLFKYSKSVTWLKFTLKNNTLSPIVPITVGRSVIDDFAIYYKNDSTNKVIRFSAHDLAKGKHVLSQTVPLINWPIKPSTTQTLYIRIKSAAFAVIPIEVHSYDEFEEQSAIDKLLDGGIIGIFAVMALFNLMLYFTVGDKSYLYYVLYIIFLGLSQILLLGYGNNLIPDNRVTLNNLVFPLIRVCFGYSILLFADVFLQLKQNFKYYKYYLSLYGLYTIPLLAALLGWVGTSYLFITISIFVLSLALLYIGCYLYFKGFTPAKFFLVGWGLSLVAILVSVGRSRGIVPYNFLSANILIYSSIIELILFSIALADKINFYREQNTEAQSAALQIAKENERLITEQNILLENKVKERTQALINTNENLTVTIENLQSAQNHLIETEKMASLGQLTAGVAHEINNPINFVSANVNPLRLDFDELFELLDQYDAAANNPDKPELLRSALAYKQKIDPEFIKDEIKSLLDGIEDGAGRTSEIVQSLRTFSRMDHLVLKPANINSCILNTLILLRSSIPHYIQVNPLLDKLEPLNCYSGKIDQMLVNLIDNSIHAIKAKPEHKDESILIISEDHPNYIAIKITDTGIGMSPDVKHRVFEPFFTTKEIGEGTGLGLSIVFGIIEKHKGTIDIQSTPGAGTTFSITLPKNLESNPEETELIK